MADGEEVDLSFHGESKVGPWACAGAGEVKRTGVSRARGRTVIGGRIYKSTVVDRYVVTPQDAVMGVMIGRVPINAVERAGSVYPIHVGAGIVPADETVVSASDAITQIVTRIAVNNLCSISSNNPTVVIMSHSAIFDGASAECVDANAVMGGCAGDYRAVILGIEAQTHVEANASVPGSGAGGHRAVAAGSYSEVTVHRIATGKRALISG